VPATSAETQSVICPHCKQEGQAQHFCTACDHIQPIPARLDFFSFLDLPRKLGIDEEQLEHTFYSLSRKFHPDYFTTASAGEQQASIERSSMLNDAYRTLRDRVARAQYLLALEGYREAEKKAPPDLLEEVFELNMQIEELKAAKKMGDHEEIDSARTSLDEALASLSSRLDLIDSQLVDIFERWDAVFDSPAEASKKQILDQMSQLLSYRSYIRNLVRDIKEEI